MKTAFIFPAFISEFIGTEVQILNSLSDNFLENLEKASAITSDDFTKFSITDTAYTEDELRSQVITYIFSCSLADVLISKGMQPDVMAGYSMGLYATIYTGGAINFEDGIKLINKAYSISKKIIGNIESNMGSIIGLTVNEIEEIISNNRLEVEIANTNSIHSHLITGSKKEVHQLLIKARETGALNTSLLKVSTPYHSKLLKNTEEDLLEFIKDNIKFKHSSYPIISSINQKMIKSADQIQKELVMNLFTKINWMDTFNHLQSMGVSQFIECGAGKSLYKTGRFMPGIFSIYPMNKLNKLI